MAQKQRLSASITIGAALDRSVKQNIGFLNAGLAEVGDKVKAVERRQRELAAQRKTFIRQGQSVAALDREYEDLETTLRRLKRAQEGWTRAAAASRRVGFTFNSMASDLGRRGRQIAVGAGIAGAAIFGLAKSTADLGDNTAKTADKLGIEIGALQELRYAAERSGVTVGEFDKGIEKMQKNLGEASTGTGAAKDALDQLGLSADDLINKTPDEALAIIADKMQGVGTQAERAAIANDIFGRSGIGMLNMLKDGSAGLVQLRQDALRTGYVLSEKAARDAEVFQDTLLDTQLTMKGLKNTVGAELLPVITVAMRRVGDTLIDNRNDVQRWARDFAGGVERALPIVGEVVSGMLQVTRVVGDVVSWTARMAGGWDNLGMIIGGVLAGRTVLKIARFGLAVASLGGSMISLARSTPLVVGGIRAIGTALVANPIGLAVTAIAGGAYLIYKNWGTVGPWFKKQWGGVKETFGGLSDFVGGVFTGDMGRAGAGLVRSWNGYKSLVRGQLRAIGAGFTWAWENAIRPVTDAMGVTSHIEAGWVAAKNVLGSTLSGISDVFRGLSEFVGGVFTGDMGRAGAGLVSAWGGYRASMKRKLDSLGSAFSWVWDNAIKPVTDKMGITSHIEAGWYTAKSVVSGHLDGLRTSFSGLGTFIGGVFTGDMDAARAGIIAGWNSGKAGMQTALDGIGSVFSNVWTTAIKPVTDSMGMTTTIEAGWESAKAALSSTLGLIGSAFDGAWLNFIKPVIDGLSGVESIGQVWENLKASIGTVLDWMGDKFAWIEGIIAPVIDSLRWVKESGAGILSSIGIGGAEEGGAPKQTWGQYLRGEPATEAQPTVQERVLGGTYNPGWLLTGEKGPELRFENRGGFIANNRALRQMAGHASSALKSEHRLQSLQRPASGRGRRPFRPTIVGANKSQRGNVQTEPSVPQSIGPDRMAVGSAKPRPTVIERVERAVAGSVGLTPVAQSQVPETSTLVSHEGDTINIYAQGTSAQEVVALIERQKRIKAQGSLYDRVSPHGPAGR